jgi:alkaline phosphatase D
MLGHVSSTNALIWANASGAAQLGVRISAEATLASGRAVEGPPLEADTGFMGHVDVGGLRPGTRYFYCVQLDGKPAMLPPFPSFTTAPPEGESDHVRFAFASCVGYHGYDATAGSRPAADARRQRLLQHQ